MGDIKTKHLAWIIPMTAIVFFMMGLYIGIPNHITIEMDVGDNMLDMTKTAERMQNFTRPEYNVTICNMTMPPQCTIKTLK
jgi:hypothetical protein